MPFNWFALRTTLYSFVLVTSLAQVVSSVWAVAYPESTSFLRPSSAVYVAFAIITTSVTSVMLYFNGRPQSNHKLTQAFSHLVVFSAYSVIWLVLVITMATQTTQCDFTHVISDGFYDEWCSSVFVLTILSSILIGFSAASIVSIYLSVKYHGGGFSGNVAAGDKKFLKPASAEENYTEMT